MSGEVISAKDVVKKFGDKIAVNKVNLSVFRGEIFGFLGPNGAGKTTTIRLLAGALEPDDGDIRILGKDYKNDAIDIKRRIGVVPDEPPRFKNIKGKEFLKFIASVYKCEKDVYDRLDELCELLNIDFLNDYIDNYSHGMKQKLMVASVVMRKPDIMFLDEPTTGLDPYSARGLKLLLRRIADDGSAIFLTTHILEIAEKMCDKLTVIANGEIVAEGTVEQLRQKAGMKGDLEEIFLQLTGADETEIRKLVNEL
ncbi:ABC transporter ATP-binding protein [bacterium]|nr:ABC transporter ATP-binding protein [bacterium]